MSAPTEATSALGHAGRRCHVCRTGRGSRRFEVVHIAGGEPVFVCAGCRARLGDDAAIERQAMPVAQEAPAPQRATSESAEKTPRKAKQRPDRLRAALAKMDDVFSTAMIARQAGLSDAKTLARLQQLERAGEVRRVGKRWSTESPRSELDAAMDRLAAQTNNLRIIREPARLG